MKRVSLTFSAAAGPGDRNAAQATRSRRIGFTKQIRSGFCEEARNSDIHNFGSLVNYIL